MKAMREFVYVNYTIIVLIVMDYFYIPRLSVLQGLSLYSFALVSMTPRTICSGLIRVPFNEFHR